MVQESEKQSLADRKSDRRRSSRIAIPLQLGIFRSSTSKALFKTVAENMSDSGICFALSSSLRCGKGYQSRITFPNQKILDTEFNVLSVVSMGKAYIHRAHFTNTKQREEIHSLLTEIQSASTTDRRRSTIGTTSLGSSDRRVNSQTELSGPALLDANELKVRLKQLENEFVRLSHLQVGTKTTFYNRVVSCMHQMCAVIGECELAGISRDEILELIKNARDIHGRSPFVSRLQKWPRGYQGDFETIEYLMNQKNFSPRDSIEYCIEQYALSSPIAQQHRNKVLYQSDMILRTISGPSGRHVENANIPKILSIACGSSPDIRRILPQIGHQRFQIVLNDIDGGALETTRNALQPIADRYVTILGNVLTKLNAINAYGPFNLIVAGGLFDYLPSRHISILLKKLYAKSLAPGGKIIFTNIAAGNPFRLWLEYFVDWFLIERTEDDIARMLSDLYIPLEDIHLIRDPSHLSILAEIIKPTIERVKA